MITKCPECNNYGKVSENLVGGGVLCPQCGSSFIADDTQESEWFYADGDNRIGPIKQKLFVSLVDDGTIEPDALFWCNGMKGWQALPEVQGVANGVECDECHKSFSPNLLQDHNGGKVCNSCLPLLETKTDEATASTLTTKRKLKYGGLVGRAIAKFIDLLLMLAIGAMCEGLSRKLFPSAYAANMLSSVVMMTFVINMLAGVIYLTWFVGKFGATPGKMAMNLKITDPYGRKIGYRHAFGRYCGEYIAALGGLGCIAMLVCWGLSYYLPLYPVLTTPGGAILIAAVISYAPAILDPQRKTLYDRYCSTRVLAA